MTLADLRLAARSLRKAPGFTSAALIILSLGMTLCTTAMVVFNAYLLRDLPYPAAARLYWIRYAAPGQDQLRNLEALDWDAVEEVIEYPIAWDLDMFYLVGGEHAESAPGAWVTRGFVEGLGIQPAIGRGFDASAFAPGAPNVALISHRLWSNRFGSDPAIVGRTFTAYVSDRPQEAEAFTISGVLPPTFWHINPYTDIIAPLRAPTYPYMARLRQGVTPAAAAARITALVRAGGVAVPETWAPAIVSAHEAHVMQIRPMLRAVSAAATLVLFVACANVAGLSLVRATRRQREIAVRTALGAGRAAIGRMLLAEGVVLGGTAALLALLATKAVLASLAPAIQQQVGRPVPGGLSAFSIDVRVMTFAAAVGVLTAIACALAPLVTSRRPQIASALQGASRGMTEGRTSQRVRATLIAVEIAVSLTLLAGSALMVRSVVRLLDADLGFSAERVLNASLTLRQNRYPDAASRAAVFERIAERVGAVPGVEAVGLTTVWPAQRPQNVPIETSGTGQQASARAAVHTIDSGYLDALEIPLVAGRAFQRGDGQGSEPVAIVSESLARLLWPSGDALGGRLVVPQPQERGEPVAVTRAVVGMAKDVRQDPGDTELADVYVPMLQAPTRFAFVLVRTSGAPAAALPALRSALHDVDPEFALDRARPLQAIIGETTTRPRFMASLLASFAVTAAVLALVGLYGVIAYAVRQREREIAVRLAVGADPARITRLFLQQGGVMILVGISLGVAGALAAGRLIESHLVGVTARDPIALGAAVLAFSAAGLLAIWHPARRAATTDPAKALRSE
jgi:predicted permease